MIGVIEFKCLDCKNTNKELEPDEKSDFDQIYLNNNDYRFKFRASEHFSNSKEFSRPLNLLRVNL